MKNGPTYLWLLKASEDHLSSRNILLRIQEIVIQGVLCPMDSLLLVGLAIGVAFSLTRLATKETTEVRALLVASTLLSNVALSAPTNKV